MMGNSESAKRQGARWLSIASIGLEVGFGDRSSQCGQECAAACPLKLRTRSTVSLPFSHRELAMDSLPCASVSLMRMAAKTPEIRILDSPDALAYEAAREFVRLALESAEGRGQFRVALAGGSTPKRLYSLLATDAGFRESAPWDRIHFFWGDERHVPPEHAESNYRMAFDAMLSRVPVPSAQVHRIEAENPNAREAAEEYQRLLVRHFGLDRGELPRLSLALLGLGADAHTASLFPGTDVLDEQERIVAAPWVEKFQAFRVTLTAPALNHAQNVIFLVSGEDKARALKSVLQGEFQPQQFPAQLIRPVDGNLLWLIDRAAAQLL
jgi:6-phosphogluconolactonase